MQVGYKVMSDTPLCMPSLPKDAVIGSLLRLRRKKAINFLITNQPPNGTRRRLSKSFNSQHCASIRLTTLLPMVRAQGAVCLLSSADSEEEINEEGRRSLSMDVDGIQGTDRAATTELIVVGGIMQGPTKSSRRDLPRRGTQWRHWLFGHQNIILRRRMEILKLRTFILGEEGHDGAEEVVREGPSTFERAQGNNNCWGKRIL